MELNSILVEKEQEFLYLCKKHLLINCQIDKDNILRVNLLFHTSDGNLIKINSDDCSLIDGSKIKK